MSEDRALTLYQQLVTDPAARAALGLGLDDEPLPEAILTTLADAGVSPPAFVDLVHQLADSPARWAGWAADGFTLWRRDHGGGGPLRLAGRLSLGAGDGPIEYTDADGRVQALRLAGQVLTAADDAGGLALCPGFARLGDALAPVLVGRIGDGPALGLPPATSAAFSMQDVEKHFAKWWRAWLAGLLGVGVLAFIVARVYPVVRLLAERGDEPVQAPAPAPNPEAVEVTAAIAKEWDDLVAALVADPTIAQAGGLADVDLSEGGPLYTEYRVRLGVVWTREDVQQRLRQRWNEERRAPYLAFARDQVAREQAVAAEGRPVPEAPGALPPRREGDGAHRLMGWDSRNQRVLGPNDLAISGLIDPRAMGIDLRALARETGMQAQPAPLQGRKDQPIDPNDLARSGLFSPALLDPVAARQARLDALQRQIDSLQTAMEGEAQFGSSTALQQDSVELRAAQLQLNQIDPEDSASAAQLTAVQRELDGAHAQVVEVGTHRRAQMDLDQRRQYDNALKDWDAQHEAAERAARDEEVREHEADAHRLMEEG